MIGNEISKAITILTQNEVVAIPTETVYGLAANALNEASVQAIFTIKKRPRTSPLIVHTYTLSQLLTFVKEIPPIGERLAKAFWPGPLTLLLEKKAIIPDIVTANRSTVAVRIPNHPLTLELLSKLPFPLAAPSANLFGYISPTTAEHVDEQLGDKIPYILDGGSSQRGLESTIIGFKEKKPVIYRLGSITQEEISSVIGFVPYLPPQKIKKGAELAPGRTLQHYSPHTPILLGNLTDLYQANKVHRLTALCFDRPLKEIPLNDQFILSPQKSLKEAAKNLFAALYYLDKKEADYIIAPLFPEEGLGRVINERLKRASATNAFS